jgi:hypothetical protein
MGYETGEREELCDYIDATITESGLAPGLAAALLSRPRPRR